MNNNEQHDDGTLEAVHVHFEKALGWSVYKHTLLNNNKDLQVEYRKDSTGKSVTKDIYARNAKFYY